MVHVSDDGNVSDILHINYTYFERKITIFLAFSIIIVILFSPTRLKNLLNNIFSTSISMILANRTAYNAPTAYSGMLRIQSCLRYGDIENLTPSRPL